VRIAVEGGGYDTAAEALVGGNQLAALYYNGLIGKLGGYGAMGGDDTTSEEFATEYDRSAKEAVDGLNDLVDSFANLAELTAQSIDNHRRANGDSVYGTPPVYDGSQGLGDSPVDVATYTPPSALGGDDEDLPDFWNEIVDHLEGFAWPNADLDKLRSAATTWRDAAGDVSDLKRYCESANRVLSGQQSPEIPLATNAISDLSGLIDDLSSAFTSLGEACEDYATQVDEHRGIIKDIVRDMAIEAGVSVVAGAVVGFFTAGIGAGAGAAIAGWRIASAARKILTALRALKAIAKAGAVAKLASATTKVKGLRDKLKKFKEARKLKKASEATDPPPTPKKPKTPSGTDAPPSVKGPNGEDLPAVPDGATPVRPADTGKGHIYEVPKGTEGLDPRVTEVRVMDPVTSGPHQYPNGYVNYMNAQGQAVNPVTGQTIGKKDPYWHIPLPP
jgi:hypothetical protein